MWPIRFEFDSVDHVNLKTPAGRVPHLLNVGLKSVSR